MSYTVFPQVFFIAFFSLGYAFLLTRSSLNGKEKQFSNTCGIYFVIYISILLYLAAVNRGSQSVRSLELMPFSSYAFVLTTYNSFDVLSQIFQNILVFIPSGILIPRALFLANKKCCGIFTVLIGFFISFFIELCQYTYAIGYSEFDDLFNNTLGCIIGYGIFCFCNRITVNEDGFFIKRQAFAGLLPLIITVSLMLMIIIYREIILFNK